MTDQTKELAKETEKLKKESEKEQSYLVGMRCLVMTWQEQRLK